MIATHVTHKGAIKEAAQGIEEVTSWLARNGLKTDPDKTEFLLFYKRKRPNQGSIPASIGLQDPINGEYAVKRSMTVRYLGIFISHNLSFDHHIKVMATRAKSTVQAINILGNSVQGLDLAGWRKIYHALILPVLTYGLPLYASRIKKGAVKVLQVAQNAALRKICGVFKTTPVEPLPYMSAILPMSVYIPMALAKFGDRLSRLPPTHMLRTLPLSNAVARYRSSLEPRTCITRLAPSINFSPPFSFPAHPALHRWSHDRLREVSSLTPSETAHIDARRNFKTPSYDTFQITIHPIPIPSPFCFYWRVIRGGRLLKEGTTMNERKQRAMLQAVLAAITYGSTFFSSHIHFFLPAPADSISLFRLSKHADLFYSHLISTHLFQFLLADALHHVTVLRLSANGPDALRKDHCHG